MRHGSLFSGIGGFDLAAQWMGWENVFQVEIDPFCQKVLEKNFPNTKRHGDIKEFDGTQYRGAIDIVSGGFPCQPASHAGKRKGKDDDRWLWPEMFRVSMEIRPRFIVWENVTGIISMGLWDMLTQLETQGYESESFVIPACAVNAIHRRDRVWVLSQDSNQVRRNSSQREGKSKERRFGQFSAGDHERIYTEKKVHANTPSIGQPGSGRPKPPGNQKSREERQENRTFNELAWPTESPVYSPDNGVSLDLVRSAIGGAGNAIVPQVAFEIFKAIQATIDGPLLTK